MKAILVREFGPPEVMRLADVPDPSPGPGQLLIQIGAAGVNPVETYIRSGTYTRTSTLPYTPGSDAAGVVEQAGDGVRSFVPGDRVYTSGTVTGAYAELAVCDASRVHPLPENVSFAQGSAVGIPYATAWRALFQKAKALPGETVLVHGASGGVGVAAVQIARAAGLHVIGTAGTAEGVELALREGAHYAFDHRSPGYLEKAVATAGGRGFDAILEMLANVNLPRDLKSLAMGGRVVVIRSRGTAEIDPRDTMGRDASIVGMSLFNMSDADRFTVHAALVAGLGNGTLRPVIGREMPLSAAPESHVAVMSPGAKGKIVLVP